MGRLLLVLPLLLSLCGAPAFAQSNCFDRDTVVSSLGAKYSERQVFIGRTSQNTIVEVFVNRETGTWTALVSQPDGSTSCLVASGEVYILLELQQPKGEKM